MFGRNMVSIIEIAYKCKCPHAAIADGSGGFMVSTSQRTGYRHGCRAHPTPPVIEEDTFAFEPSKIPPSATS